MTLTHHSQSVSRTTTETRKLTRWTEDQIGYALDHEGLMSHAELARLLGKTPKAVEAKIARVKGPARRHFERAQLDTNVPRETSRGKRLLTPARLDTTE